MLSDAQPSLPTLPNGPDDWPATLRAVKPVTRFTLPNDQSKEFGAFIIPHIAAPARHTDRQQASMLTDLIATGLITAFIRYRDQKASPGSSLLLDRWLTCIEPIRLDLLDRFARSQGAANAFARSKLSLWTFRESNYGVESVPYGSVAVHKDSRYNSYQLRATVRISVNQASVCSA